MKRFRTYVIGGLCASVMALFLWGCSQQAAYPGGNDTEVRVGINLSLTGPGSSYCRSTEQGIELAKDMINEKGGLMGKMLPSCPSIIMAMLMMQQRQYNNYRHATLVPSSDPI